MDVPCRPGYHTRDRNGRRVAPPEVSRELCQNGLAFADRHGERTQWIAICVCQRHVERDGRGEDLGGRFSHVMKRLTTTRDVPPKRRCVGEDGDLDGLNHVAHNPNPKGNVWTGLGSHGKRGRKHATGARKVKRHRK